MDFSAIKIGDTIRVNQAARSKPVGFGAKRVEVPATTSVVRVTAISNVAGQPGRSYLQCVVLVTEAGEVLAEPDLMFPAQADHHVLGQQRYADQRPSVEIYNDTIGQTFEAA